MYNALNGHVKNILDRVAGRGVARERSEEEWSEGCAHSFYSKGCVYPFPKVANILFTCSVSRGFIIRRVDDRIWMKSSSVKRILKAFCRAMRETVCDANQGEVQKVM